MSDGGTEADFMLTEAGRVVALIDEQLLSRRRLRPLRDIAIGGRWELRCHRCHHFNTTSDVPPAAYHRGDDNVFDGVILAAHFTALLAAYMRQSP